MTDYTQWESAVAAVEAGFASKPDGVARLAAFRAAAFAGMDAHPDGPLVRGLFVNYAESRGGLTLELIRLMHGPLWGWPIVHSIDQCADLLGVPVEELRDIYRGMADAIRPALLGRTS